MDLTEFGIVVMQFLYTKIDKYIQTYE